MAAPMATTAHVGAATSRPEGVGQSWEVSISREPERVPCAPSSRLRGMRGARLRSRLALVAIVLPGCLGATRVENTRGHWERQGGSPVEVIGELMPALGEMRLRTEHGEYVLEYTSDCQYDLSQKPPEGTPALKFEGKEVYFPIGSEFRYLVKGIRGSAEQSGAVLHVFYITRVDRAVAPSAISPHVQ